MTAIAGLALLAAVNSPAEASTVSGSYTGYVTNLNFGTVVPGAPAINLNDPYTFNYSYDTAAPLHGTTDGGLGDHGASYFAGNISGTVGGFHFAFTQSFAETNDFPSGSLYADRFSSWSCEGCFGPATSDIPGWSVDFVILTAYFDSTTLNGIGLPSSALDPANDWDDVFQITLKQAGTGTAYYVLGGNLPVTTPIPASGVLFLTALGGFGFPAWTRRRA